MDTRIATGLVILLVVCSGCTGLESDGRIGGLPRETAEPTPTPTPTPTEIPSATFQDTPTRTAMPIEPDTPARAGGNIQVRVGGPGHWSGTISYRGLTRRIEGNDDRRLSVPRGTDTLTVSVRKEGEGSWPIVIEVYVDGQLIEQETTRAEYGQLRTAVSFG